MSRVGKSPIPIPAGVEVKIDKDGLRFKGPKGELESPIPAGITFEIERGLLTAKRSHESNRLRALHGLARALAANAAKGVHEGFMKQLEIVGIGYKALVEGRELVCSLGYSHPIRYPIPQGISITVERADITVSGIDKQRIGQVAAEIRSLRKPDAYKGKGIRYKDETIKLKAGKAGK